MSDVKALLLEYINAGNVDDACKLIDGCLHDEIDYLKNDPEYCVLAATAYLQNDILSRAFDLISLGLLCDNHNYELYLMLGEYYGRSNINQALLCFYQALFYCDVEDDKQIIESYIENVVNQGASVRQVSVVVVTHDQSEQLKKCLDSIVTTIVPGIYEIVVIDNCSIDETEKWVSDIEGINYWRSEEILDYARAANQGIRISGSFNDVFLLDADYVLADNSFFYLMLGLYSDMQVGAIGGITNECVSDQKLFIATSDLKEVHRQAEIINSPMREAYEKVVYVSDCAILIRRDALEKVGILDEQFASDTYADKDLCTRINYAGMQVLLCYNSYIFKFADRYVINKNNGSDAENKDTFFNKWGFGIDYSNSARDSLISLIKSNTDAEIQILELGCAMGSTLHRIKRLWPKARVFGVEYDKAVVRVAEKMGDIIQGDVESMDIPYANGQFDYIICADILEHLRDPQATLKRFMPYLKDSGHFIISLPNIRHYAVIMMLALEGRFDYASDGILDATHLRFFTLDTAKEMIEGAGLKVVDVLRNYNDQEDDNEFITRLKQNYNVYEPDEMKVFQYYFVAAKNV